MKNQTFGMMVASLRKEKEMTQSELAEKMGITDKAVSKWERDLSYPDVSSLPLLAKILDVSVDELMQGKQHARGHEASNKIGMLADIVFKGVGLAMGIAVAVLSILDRIEVKSAVGMLGIGVACLAISTFQKKDE